MVTREELMGLRKTQLAGTVIQCGWKKRRPDLSLQQDAITAPQEALINFLLMAQESHGYDLTLSGAHLTVTEAHQDEQTAAQMARIEPEDAPEPEAVVEEEPVKDPDVEEVVVEIEEPAAEETAAEEPAAEAVAQLMHGISTAEVLDAALAPLFTEMGTTITEALKKLGKSDGNIVGKLTASVDELGRKFDLFLDRLARLEQEAATRRDQNTRIENICLWLYAMSDEPRPSSYFQVKSSMFAEVDELKAEDAEAATPPADKVKTAAPAAPVVAPPVTPPPAVPKVPAPAKPVAAPVAPPVTAPPARPVSMPAAAPAMPSIPRMGAAASAPAAQPQVPSAIRPPTAPRTAPTSPVNVMPAKSK